MKFAGTFLFLLFCSVSLFGQNDLSLSGTVLDKTDNQPIVAGSIELLNAKDSVFVKGAVSSADGLFSFKNVTAGNYILRITYIGYLTFTQNVRLNSSINIGTIYLNTNDILLQETVVVGRRPDVIVRNDTIEYDAGAYKVTENAVIEDLLKKMPGIEVDKDGKITANGKEVKKILLDGKEFFSDDPQIASKNLPAEMVEKLQVVDRKSDMAQMTGFDDGEEETIINLTVRPNMKKGTMGNALVGMGRDLQSDPDSRYQAGAFVNHLQKEDQYTLIAGTNNNNNMGAADLGADQFGDMRVRRGGGGIAETTNFMMRLNKSFSPEVTLNGDVRYTGSERFSTNKSYVETQWSAENTQSDSVFTNNNYRSNSVAANFKLDWKPDTTNTLIFRPNIRYNNSNSEESEWLNRFWLESRNGILETQTDSRTKGEGYGFGGRLDYSHKFAKPGRVFSTNIRGSYSDSYSWEKSWSEILFQESTANPLSDLNQRDENDNRSDNYRGTVSWVEPLGNGNFLQALYRISYFDTKSINSTYDLYEPEHQAIRNDSLSRSTVRNSTEQRIGLSFKAVRKKYNYTIGFNVDPTRSINETWQPSSNNPFIVPYYDSRLANLMGDTLISSISQNVVNFSPVLNFNYLFGQRTNLRIEYEGETNQPSANQLRNFVDKSRPTAWVAGNPSLKPGYQNRLNARFNKYVPETQLMYNLNWTGRFSVNDIASVTQMLDGGIRQTTYQNINGNWNMQLRGMFNVPLRNKKFSVGGFAMTEYRNQNSYVNVSKNTMQNFVVRDNFNVNYRSDLFDIGMNTSVNYSNITYSIRPENNQTTSDLRVGGYTAWYLPYGWTVESDINWMQRNGYAAEFNIPETIWNAAITKLLFSKKQGTGSLKLQIYDILQDRNTISASYTTNGFRSTEINSIPSYSMFSFIYKFSAFPTSGSTSDRRSSGGPGEGGRPQGPPPGVRMF